MDIPLPELIRLAKIGNTVGFNRQLNPDRLTDLPDTVSILFAFIHEHIRGEPVEPHVRMVTEAGIIDVPLPEFNALNLGKAARIPQR